jgi:hypothetical protein
MLRPAAGALILALAIAITGSVALLGGQSGDVEDARPRELEALLASIRQSSAVCTSGTLILMNRWGENE